MTEQSGRHILSIQKDFDYTYTNPGYDLTSALTQALKAGVAIRAGAALEANAAAVLGVGFTPSTLAVLAIGGGTALYITLDYLHYKWNASYENYKLGIMRANHEDQLAFEASCPFGWNKEFGTGEVISMNCISPIRSGNTDFKKIDFKEGMKLIELMKEKGCVTEISVNAETDPVAEELISSPAGIGEHSHEL